MSGTMVQVLMVVVIIVLSYCYSITIGRYWYLFSAYGLTTIE